MDFIQSFIGLVSSIVLVAGGVLALVKAYRELSPKTPTSTKAPGRGWLLFSIVLLLTGIAIVGARVGYPRPTVAITTPSSSLEVTAEGHSVWFPVSGTSTSVASDNALRVYVLVQSGTEWHIQGPASVESSGDWTLARGWIGDASAPVAKGSTLRIAAVASRQLRAQDEKVRDIGQLDPEAESATIVATVREVRASAKP